jgi:hypothetical protein
MERLLETTPIFPREIIKNLTRKLGEDRYSDVMKPPILNGICSSNNFRHQWYLEPPTNNSNDNDDNDDNVNDDDTLEIKVAMI